MIETFILVIIVLIYALIGLAFYKALCKVEDIYLSRVIASVWPILLLMKIGLCLWKLFVKLTTIPVNALSNIIEKIFEKIL